MIVHMYVSSLHMLLIKGDAAAVCHCKVTRCAMMLVQH